jgi:hypothetical protein
MLPDDVLARCESAQFIKNPGHPIKVPFWTAGISFSTSQAIRDVPYDPYTPYLFDGEEFSTAARLWTWGYDVYAPFTDIVFHVYESRYKRNKVSVMLHDLVLPSRSAGF